MTTVALVDDHVLLRNGLASLVTNLGYQVLFEANHGDDFIANMKKQGIPDLVLMDINMPVKDGYETTLWLKKNHPGVLVLALSMYDDESAIIRMLKSGARGYIMKDSEPAELRAALEAIIQKGFYYSEMVTGRLVRTISDMDEEGNVSKNPFSLSDREIEFLKLACTEMTYKEIADKMNLSPRTIDGYRDSLFEKLDIKTRTGLVIYAIRNGIVKI
ncbi:MAG TPA: response regulator transcription factor [Chitinophagaceae bacterium]|nr:response regulator transcription factor [Chitinophagaceae bacterium]